MGEPTLTAHSLSIPLKFPDPIPYKPEGVIGIDSNEGNLTAFVTSTGEIREIDTGYVGKVNRDHLRREIKGTRGKRNPKAKKEDRLQTPKDSPGEDGELLASSGPGADCLGAGDAGGSGAGGPSGDEGADREGEVQEDAAASAQLLEHYDFPPDPGSQGKILRGSGDFCGSAEHVPGVSGMRQGGRPAKGTRPGVPLRGEDGPSRGGGGEHRPQGDRIPRGLGPSRQGSVGDPGGRSSGPGLKTQGHDRNTQKTA
jgi:hypothetical protein